MDTDGFFCWILMAILEDIDGKETTVVLVAANMTRVMASFQVVDMVTFHTLPYEPENDGYPSFFTNISTTAT